MSAVKERYGSNQLTLTAAELEDLQRAMNAPSLEMVGFEKIKQQQRYFILLVFLYYCISKLYKYQWRHLISTKV